MRISATPRQDQRRYNLPTESEVALFLPNAPMGENRPRDIVVRVRGDRPGLQRISEFHAAFDPLHFVLLFPRGELGWHPTEVLLLGALL